MTNPRSAIAVGMPPATATPWIQKPESQQVRAAWSQNSSTLPRVALYGAAGIGKTQIASAIFREQRESLDVALWVTAHTLRHVISSYAAAADSLGVTAASNTNSHSEEERARSFLERLASAPRLDCLVVLDDLSIPDDQMESWWPPLGPGLRTLVTTRRPSSFMRSDHWVGVSVAVVTKESATEFLRIAAPENTRGQDPTVIEALSESSGGLPVTLQQIASLLRSDGRSPAEVLEYLVKPARAAQSLLAAGRTVEAENQLRALVEAQRDALGPEDPNTLARRANLAAVIAKSGRPREALAYTEELLADQERVLGPDHPTTLTTRANLAQLLGQAGHPQYAIDLLHALLADQERVLGPDHPTTRASHMELAYWLGESGDPNGALAVLAELRSGGDPDRRNATVGRSEESRP